MSITIRPITVDDAAAYNAYQRSIVDEPHNTIDLEPGEYTRTVKQERERIISVIDDQDAQILLAIIDGQICGQCMCRGSKKLAACHRVGLSIDVARNHRNQGIGTALMDTMLTWVRENPRIKRVELEVFATNRIAISLYIKQGFVIEGCKQRAYFKNGVFINAYVMGLHLDQAM